MLEAVDLALDYPDFHARYTLTVPAKALCGLIGPSGGGKTTLLHAIAGFEQPTSGALRFAGQDLLPLKPAERPLSMLFQDHNLFPHLTTFENVALGVDPRLHLDQEKREAVIGALARVGLPGLEKRRPAELSGGQRQRVSIARALVRKRPLMLLDEPFGGLDPGLRKEMIALVDALRRAEGLTVLVSIHTPEDLGEAADLMAFIADGRVLAVAPPAELLRGGRNPSNRSLPRTLRIAYLLSMKRFAVIAAAAAIVAAIVALIVPMWTMTAHVALDPFAFKMIVLMVIGCFAVGGGLMFLVFYSARKGYDDRVHHGGGGYGPDGPD